MKKLALLFVIAFIVGFVAAPAGAGLEKNSAGLEVGRAEKYTAYNFVSWGLDNAEIFSELEYKFGKLVFTNNETNDVNETYKCKFKYPEDVELPPPGDVHYMELR